MTTERLAEIKLVKETIRAALAKKEFKNLSTREKDKLLETNGKNLRAHRLGPINGGIKMIFNSTTMETLRGYIADGRS